MSENVVRVSNASDEYKASEQALYEAFRNSPIPAGEFLENLYMFMTPHYLRRVLFFYELYQKILPVTGSILQLGVRWGRDLALLDSLRTTFEPFNLSRRIVGFDTFEGFQGTDPKDGVNPMIQEGNLGTAQGYEQILHELLRTREKLSPLGHIQKFDLIKGDATKTLPAYLESHPETIVAMAYFDFDIYAPTVQCLEILKPYLTKGTLVVFDELNRRAFPGETIAVREALGLSRIRLERHPYVNPTWPSYFVVE